MNKEEHIKRNEEKEGEKEKWRRKEKMKRINVTIKCRTNSKTVNSTAKFFSRGGGKWKSIWLVWHHLYYLIKNLITYMYHVSLLFLY